MAGVKGKGLKFTKKDFDIIKTLLGHGLSSTEIARITNRSSYTIRRVKHSNDWREYEIQKAKRLEQLKIREEPGTLWDLSRDQLDPSSSDSKEIVVMEKLAVAINRLCDLMEGDTPLREEAKQFKLFGRNK